MPNSITINQLESMVEPNGGWVLQDTVPISTGSLLLMSRSKPDRTALFIITGSINNNIVNPVLAVGITGSATLPVDIAAQTLIPIYTDILTY